MANHFNAGRCSHLKPTLQVYVLMSYYITQCVGMAERAGKLGRLGGYFISQYRKLKELEGEEAQDTQQMVGPVATGERRG